MKKLFITLAIALFPLLSLAATEAHLDKAGIDPTDKASLRRGSETFMHYCFSCHSAKFERFNRMAQDLGIDDKTLADKYLRGGEKPGDTMQVAMNDVLAKKWFGTKIPDLSLIARARGVDYLYTYLRSFYLDDTRPFGVNNVAFPGAAMPDVLWELQGWQKAVFKMGADGKPTDQIEHLELVKPGKLSPEEFDATVRDLVNFLSYVGEPIQTKRRALGVWVLGFLAVFFVLTYLLKKEYWRDIH